MCDTPTTPLGLVVASSVRFIGIRDRCPGYICCPLMASKQDKTRVKAMLTQLQQSCMLPPPPGPSMLRSFNHD